MADKKAQTKKLPAWAQLDEINPLKVVVDPDAAYPALPAELGVEEKDLDQYWVEVAFQAIKMDLQVAMGGFGFEIKIPRGSGKWALKNFTPGGKGRKGVDEATKGREAREHYRRIRGFVPA